MSVQRLTYNVFRAGVRFLLCQVTHLSVNAQKMVACLVLVPRCLSAVRAIVSPSACERLVGQEQVIKNSFVEPKIFKEAKGARPPTTLIAPIKRPASFIRMLSNEMLYACRLRLARYVKVDTEGLSTVKKLALPENLSTDKFLKE
jgi:hypothetical protein